MKEVWKDIEGYEGLYQISNLGRVKSLERKRYNGSRYGYGKLKERILKLSTDSSGYNRITLHKNKDRKNKKVYRLVAENFIPNPLNKKTVNHINGIKNDDRLSNLEWATHQENMQHAIRTKLIFYNVHKYEKQILKDYNNHVTLKKIFNRYHITQKSLYDLLNKRNNKKRGANKYKIDFKELKKDIERGLKPKIIMSKHGIPRGVYGYYLQKHKKGLI